MSSDSKDTFTFQETLAGQSWTLFAIFLSIVLMSISISVSIYSNYAQGARVADANIVTYTLIADSVEANKGQNAEYAKYQEIAYEWDNTATDLRNNAKRWAYSIHWFELSLYCLAFPLLLIISAFIKRKSRWLWLSTLILLILSMFPVLFGFLNIPREPTNLISVPLLPRISIVKAEIQICPTANQTINNHDWLKNHHDDYIRSQEMR